MTREEFAEGLNRVGVAVRQVPDAATLGVYFDSIGPHVTAEEWLAFARWCVDSDRFKTFLPRLPELRAALREFRGALPLEAEAVKAYERVLECGEPTTQAGTQWAYRTIRERVGDAAAEGFLAAGGHHAFATTWDEGRRRAAFVAAYTSAVLEDEGTALLPPGPQAKALPAVSTPSRAESLEILKRLDAAAPVPPPVPKTTVVILTDERLAQLRAQAQALLDSHPGGAGA